MKSRPLFPRVRCLLALVISLLCLTSASAEDFKSGKAGEPLNTLRAGAERWEATRNLVHAGAKAGGGIQVKDGRSFMARLPAPTDGESIVVEADLRVTPSAPGWVALGIGAPELGSPPWGEGVYVILDGAGRYTLAGNDDPADWQSKRMITLARGTIPDFSPDRFVKLKLEYIREPASVNVWANGVKLVDRFALTGRGFTVTPAFIGFSGIGQAAEVAIVGGFSAGDGESAPARLSDVSLRPEKVPAWWRTGEPVKFALSGAFPSDIVALKAVVTDVSGAEVAQTRTTRLEVETRGWTWRPTTPGFFEVAFFAVNQRGEEHVLGSLFTLKAPNQTTRDFARDRQGFAVVPHAPAEAAGSAAQFGFTYTLNLENIGLARLVGLNFANIHPIPWGANFTNLKMAIEPEKGVYRWELLDPHVDALVAAGMEIAGQFCYTPLWASPHPEKTNINICVVEGTAYAPADLADYGRFVEATVTRYKDRIRMWELWNEPAIPGGSVFWSDTPENFVRLMQTGYETIKRVQPEAEVWLGGLGSRSAYYAFYHRINRLGAEPFFDVLSTHGSFPDRGLDEFRRIESLHGAKPKPAVVSEWHALLQGNMQSTPILAEDALSFRMMRDIAHQLKAGFTRTLLFEMSNLTEKEALGFARENKWFTHSSGLFRRRPQVEPRHAAVVMANFLNATARQATFVREFSVSDASFGLLLSTGRGPVAMVWSQTAPITVRELAAVVGPRSTLADWEGRSVSLDGAARLEPNRMYFISAPDEAAIKRLPESNRIISTQAAARAARVTTEGAYQTAPLIRDGRVLATLGADAWIERDWKTTILKGAADSGFSARAAVGSHDDGLDIVVEVRDAEHVAHETNRQYWNGDSLQIAVDSEGVGVTGGHTELIAALTASGPVLWKISAADTRGDIPARWSPAGGEVRHADLRIERRDGVTRYLVRLEWAELYPLAHDASKPLRISFAVNNNDGAGRAAYTTWGGGVVSEKDPSAYGALTAVGRPMNP